MSDKIILTDEQIKYMIEQFLNWRLPETFQPDCGISFKPTFNEHLPFGPQKHAPVGTNLFTYVEAEAMIRNMLEGLPEAKIAEPPLLRLPTQFHSVEEVLATASKLNLTNVLVLSERENGSLVFLDSELTFAQANYLLDRMKMLLLMPEHFERKGA